MINHDRLFKQLLRAFLEEFLELFFPEIHMEFDLGTRISLDKEIFTDRMNGGLHHVDLLFMLKSRTANQVLILHIEIQAENQGEFPQRMFNYNSRLHLEFDAPVHSIAVLSFASPRRLQPGLYKVESHGWEFHRFKYTVVQLNQMDWQDFSEIRSPIAAALMAKMRIARADRSRVKLKCLELLWTLNLNPAEQALIGEFVDT